MKIKLFSTLLLAAALSSLHAQPQTATLAQAIQIPLVIGGKTVGSATLQKGSVVKILQESPDGRLLIATASGQTWVLKSALILPVAPAATPAPVALATSAPVPMQVASVATSSSTATQAQATAESPKYSGPKILVLSENNPRSKDYWQFRILEAEGYKPDGISGGQLLTEHDLAQYDVIVGHYMKQVWKLISPDAYEKLFQNEKGKLLILSNEFATPQQVRTHMRPDDWWETNKHKPVDDPPVRTSHGSMGCDIMTIWDFGTPEEEPFKEKVVPALKKWLATNKASH